MRASHYITILSAVLLIVVIYFWGNTIPPAKKQASVAAGSKTSGDMSQADIPVKPASFDSIVAASRKDLPKVLADSVVAIENELSAIRDSSRMAALFKRLAGIMRRNHMPHVAAGYLAKAAKLENSEKSLTFAGQFYVGLMENEQSPSLLKWEADEAVACLEKALELDPGSEEAKLALATAYLDGTGEPMKGVQILLGITREKPEDVPANMLLGRMSIKSGQFDKAVARFDKVLKQQPENTEALYFQAQAYEGKGEKAKAIELLEKCKRIVNDPEFSRDIDQHISSIK